MLLIYSQHLGNCVFFADPGCISFVNGSLNWLVANFGNFSYLATLKDLLALNPNFSSVSAFCTYLLLFSFCYFFTGAWSNTFDFVFTGSDSVTACSFADGTVNCEHKLLKWHSPNRSSLQSTWARQCSEKCGPVLCTAECEWTGKPGFQMHKIGITIRHKSWHSRDSHWPQELQWMVVNSFAVTQSSLSEALTYAL